MIEKVPYKQTLISMIEAGHLDDSECRQLIGLVGNKIAQSESEPVKTKAAASPKPKAKIVGPFKVHGMVFETQKDLAVYCELPQGTISRRLNQGHDLESFVPEPAIEPQTDFQSVIPDPPPARRSSIMGNVNRSQMQ